MNNTKIHFTQSVKKIPTKLTKTKKYLSQCSTTTKTFNKTSNKIRNKRRQLNENIQ